MVVYVLVVMIKEKNENSEYLLCGRLFMTIEKHVSAHMGVVSAVQLE